MYRSAAPGTRYIVVIRQLALPVKAGKKAAVLLVHTARIPKRHDIVQYMAEVIFRKLLQFFFVHDNSSPGICFPPVTP